MRNITRTLNEIAMPVVLLAGFFALPFYTIAALSS
jgi:hypothetical protein